MTKDNCECNKENGCSSEQGKVCLKHLIEPIYDTLPDNLKEMFHSLDKQKLAVLTEMKTWADKNNQKEISDACVLKIEKINKRLAQ